LWDDLTETDELMTTAMSFSGSQLAAKTAGRVKKNIDSQSQSAGAAVLTSANTTCRSYHAKGWYTVLKLIGGNITRVARQFNGQWPSLLVNLG